MKDNILAIVFVMIVAIAIGGSVAWTVLIWDECRQTNSFGYCLRLISK